MNVEYYCNRYSLLVVNFRFIVIWIVCEFFDFNFFIFCLGCCILMRVVYVYFFCSIFCVCRMLCWLKDEFFYRICIIILWLFWGFYEKVCCLLIELSLFCVFLFINLYFFIWKYVFECFFWLFYVFLVLVDGFCFLICVLVSVFN